MRNLLPLFLFVGVLWCIPLAQSAPLTEARINRVQREVQITESTGGAKPASEGATVRGSQGVRTGAQSAAELLFPDQTLARLGSDTLFTFETGTRKMDLQKGTLLFQIPKGVGGASIRTGAITAAITGTTGFIERGATHYKLVLLEGTMRVFLNDRTRESMLISGGQMLIGPIHSDSLKSWQTVQVDTAKIVKTSRLLNGGKFAPLSVEATKKINEVVAKQQIELRAGGLSPTNLVIDGYGTTLLAVENAAESNSEKGKLPDPTPTPTPAMTPTPTPGATPTPTVTPTPTPTPDITPTPTPNITPTPTPNITPTPTPNITPTPTPNITPTPTPNITPTPTPNITPTPTPNITPTPTPTDGDETAAYPAVNDSLASPLPYIFISLHSKPPINLSATFGTNSNAIMDLRSTYPTISSKNQVAFGTTYGGAALDGRASNFLFDSHTDFDVQTSFDGRFGSNYDFTFPSAGVRVFSFVDLDLKSLPAILDNGTPLPLALIIGDQLKLDSKDETLNLDDLASLTLAVKAGTISTSKDSTLAATASTFRFLHLYSRSDEVDLKGFLDLPLANLYIDAADDIGLDSDSSATFKKGLFNALGNIRLEGSTASEYLQLDAAGDLEFQGDVQTREIFALADGSLKVEGPILATPGTRQTTAGIVNLEAADTITISSSVSATSGPNANVPGAGAAVKILGKRLTGTAISITSTGQIQALLNQASTGPSGKVSLESRGGAILINGNIVAPSGTIDIRNSGTNGAITLNGATLSADVVKAGALGTNGQLNIRGGSISADTLLKLYAAGSNGTVHFQENATLNGASAKIISANTVQIDNQKIITINGSGAAQVFTNNANFTGSGGNGTTTGTFGGQGAITRPLNEAPGF